MFDDCCAQVLYREAIERLGPTRLASGSLERTLSSANGLVDWMRVDAFAERATAHEGHIARLVAEGLTNPEIAAGSYLSPPTVEWHLRKAFSEREVITRR